MLTQAAVVEGEDSRTPNESQPTPFPTQPSAGDQPPLTESSLDHDTSQDPRVDLEGPGLSILSESLKATPLVLSSFNLIKVFARVISSSSKIIEVVGVDFGLAVLISCLAVLTSGLATLTSGLAESTVLCLPLFRASSFWKTATFKTVNNISQIHAKVAGKPVVITKASIRSDPLLNDVDGIDCLTNEAIFENLALMGYEGDLTKHTFQKALFSPQWKFLIHTIIH
nr:hypothetical protein [Tanacetum cinerariifolium]